MILLILLIIEMTSTMFKTKVKPEGMTSLQKFQCLGSCLGKGGVGGVGYLKLQNDQQLQGL